LIEEKIDAIGRPEIHITKIAKDNPLEFKIITTVVPEIKIADYKKISKEEKNKVEKIEEITEKETDDAILRIRRSRADHSGHDHEKMSHEEHEKAIGASLPELDDAFVKSLGNFKDVIDFKDKVKEMLIEEKKEKAKEKKRIILSDKLIENTFMDLPEIFVESEMKRIESQFGDDITRMGVKLEDYLKHAKKTIEDLRKDWRPHAEKKAKLQLILNEISKLEKIVLDEKEIESQVNHILENYKDADREQARVYVETVLMNEKVFQNLEN
jgi:FKBP-type peptidyl-prolyl cis-trans isomerase (trigger factor)